MQQAFQPLTMYFIHAKYRIFCFHWQWRCSNFKNLDRNVELTKKFHDEDFKQLTNSYQRQIQVA